MDSTPPTIEIGLRDPASMGSLLPFPDDNLVRPDATGLVRFRARLTDAGKNINRALMKVKSAGAVLFCSPTPLTFIGAGVDCRHLPDGTELLVFVEVWDTSGNVCEAGQTVTLSHKAV